MTFCASLSLDAVSASVTHFTLTHFFSACYVLSRFFPLLPFPLKSIQLTQDVSVSFFSSRGQKKKTACSLHMVFMSNDVRAPRSTV